jgi:anti-sigma factor RsiW
MAMTDNDIELLHAYLDGELPTAECEGLWRRLAIERDLVAELDHLRADHAMRSMVWSSLEPDDLSVARLEAKLMRATRREDIFDWANNALRICASAAALILFGFAVGWMGHDRAHSLPVIPGPVSQTSSQTVPATASAFGTTPASNKYELVFKDAAGKPAAVMNFNSKEEAERFVRDLQAQSAPQNANDQSGVPTLNGF